MPRERLLSHSLTVSVASKPDGGNGDNGGSLKLLPKRFVRISRTWRCKRYSMLGIEGTRDSKPLTKAGSTLARKHE